MDVVEAIGESPLSLAVVVLTILVIIGREIALASGNTQVVRIVREMWLPYLGLLAVFVAIVVTRIILIAD